MKKIASKILFLTIIFLSYCKTIYAQGTSTLFLDDQDDYTMVTAGLPSPDPWDLVLNLINLFLIFLGTISLVFLVIGIIRLIISFRKKDKLKFNKSKNLIIASLAFIVLFLSIFFASKYIAYILITLF